MRAVVLAAVLLVAGAEAAQAAQPGALDRSFGDDGVVETTIAGGVPRVVGLEAVADGRILVVATVGADRVVLLRYLASGKRDRSFGERGVVSLPFAEGVHLDEAARTGTGDLLLTGALGPDAAVLKVRATGELDTAYGVGGIWRADFGGERSETATGVAVTADGRLVVAVDIDHGQRGIGSWNDLAVTRLSGDGKVDPTFATAGLLRVDGTTSQPFKPISLALDASGRVYVGYRSGYTPRMTSLSGVLRLSADGLLDSGYGSVDGLILFGDTTAYDMAFDAAADRVLLVGSSYDEDEGRSSPFLAGIRPRIPPDPNYGAGYGEQSAVRPAAGQHGGAALAMARDSAGSVLLGGYLLTAGSATAGTDLFVARATLAGGPDLGFGHDGRTVVRLRGHRSSIAALALQRDGRILAAGPMPPDYPKRTQRSIHLIRVHGGHDRARPRVSVRLSGERCGGRLRVTARAHDDSRLRRLSVHLDGRRLGSSRRKRLSVTARVRRAGAHALLVRAVDVAGNAATSRRRFACP